MVVSADGEILTTSAAFGDAPLANFTLANGTQGQAWVAGRDDDAGLALLTPTNPAPPYDFIQLSSAAPTIGDQMVLFQYSPFAPGLDQRITRVTGYDASPFGYSFLKIQAAGTTADGAVVVDSTGKVQGIRMPNTWLLQQQACNQGEVCAVDAPLVGTNAIPSLRMGAFHINPQPPSEDINNFPSLPIIFKGQLTIDQSAAPANTQIYVRLLKEGQPDYWEAESTRETGMYLVNISAPNNNYRGAVVEFWIDGKRSENTGIFGEGSTSSTTNVVSLDIAF